VTLHAVSLQFSTQPDAQRTRPSLFVLTIGASGTRYALPRDVLNFTDTSFSSSSAMLAPVRPFASSANDSNWWRRRRGTLNAGQTLRTLRPDSERHRRVGGHGRDGRGTRECCSQRNSNQTRARDVLVATRHSGALSGAPWAKSRLAAAIVREQTDHPPFFSCDPS
jgi:hypothetical protein